MESKVEDRMAGRERSKRPNAASIETALEDTEGASAVRLQLTLAPEYARRINELRSKMRVRSYSDVVREGLRLLEQLHRAVGNDGKLFVEKPDGTRFYIML
jgi:hypothetical protein